MPTHAHRIILTALIAALTLAALASTAAAKRPATGSAVRAIESAVTARLNGCAPGHKAHPHFLKVYVSTADARYGEALVKDYANTCFDLAVYVKRSSPTATKWTAIGDFIDSLSECKGFRFLPAAVRKDFAVKGMLANGATGQC